MSRPYGPTGQQGSASVRPPRQLGQPGAPQQAAQSGQYPAAPDPYPQQAYPSYQPTQSPAPPRSQAAQPSPYDPYSGQQAQQPNYATSHTASHYEPAPASHYPAASPQSDFAHLQVGTDARAMQRTPQYDTWQQAQDPRGYDLGGYTTAPPAGYAKQPDLGAHRYQAGRPTLDPSLGQSPEWVSQGSAQNAYAQASLDPSLGAQGHHADLGYTATGEPADQQTYEEDSDYEYEEAPRGRGLKIAAALIGAVVIGGGLAYAYTTIIGPSSGGKPPVIKSAAGPSKTKPAEPGGKQFANADSKIMGRLGEASPAEAETSGAKKVTTLTVGPDGSIKPPAPETKAETSADVGFPAAGATLAAQKADLAAPAPSAPDAPVVVTPPQAQQKQVVAAAAPAPVTTQSIEAPTAAPKVEEPAAPAKPAQTAAVQPPVAKKPALTPAAAPAAAPAAPVTSAGYVAVLASVPASSTSRMTALKQFADMQQKYSSVLQNKMPDVKEANLGERGIYHRLLVGPPGSRDAANQICGQLKSAGYTESCWVTAY